MVVAVEGEHGDRRSSRNLRSMDMRAIVIAAVAALGIGIAGSSASLAAPANGLVIGQAAGAGEVIEPVRWGWHRHHHHHHHFFFRHHHRRHWW